MSATRYLDVAKELLNNSVHNMYCFHQNGVPSLLTLLARYLLCNVKKLVDGRARLLRRSCAPLYCWSTLAPLCTTILARVNIGPLLLAK